MGKEILSRSQLKRLAEHKYSVTGVSLMEPYLQHFWKWIVLQIPESWAPNAMTLAGLVVNVVTTAILMFYGPDAKEQVTFFNYLVVYIRHLMERFESYSSCLLTSFLSML